MAAAPTHLKRHFLMMASYNVWAYETLFASIRAAALTPAQCASHQGLPFQSITGTCNHMLAADAVWYMRMAGTYHVETPHRHLQMKELAPYWNGEAGAWAGLTGGLEETEEMVASMGEHWHALVADTDEDDLEAPVRYKNTRGEVLSMELGKVLAHVVNHGTHHRGQVSSAISALSGGQYPVLDLLYYLNDNA